MIKVKEITKKFSDKKEGEITAVDSISLEIKSGEIFGLLGPNGAGKTTFLRILATILTPDSGSVIINNYDIAKQAELVKQSIGYLSGETKLYKRLTPQELLKYFGQLYDMSKQAIKTRSQKLIDVLKMNQFKDKKIAELSTGQKQKTSIARCLLHDPPVYILDEPTTGLDLMTSKAIIDFIINEAQNGKTVLFSTHYMEEAENLCDRVALLHQGKILDIATISEYYKQTKADNLRDVFFSYLD